MKFEYQIIWSGYINFSLRFKKWFDIFEKCKHGFKKATIGKIPELYTNHFTKFLSKLNFDHKSVKTP